MRGHSHSIGFHRRELLQVGFSGLMGMGLPSLLGGQARANAEVMPRRGKSVILIFLTGAPSHIDTFDMKPEAPAEVRGGFQPIPTKLPGVSICEHLPQLASRADQYAVIRSMTHEIPSHEHGTHMVLTGIDKMPPGSTHMASRSDWPCYASGLDFVRPRNDGIPNGVMLPTYLNNGYGFSGQNAGLLGSKFDPWHITQDPSAANFQIESLTLPVGLTADQLGNRRALLQEIDGQHARIDGMSSRNEFGGLQDKAFTMLTSGKVKRAFALEREDPRVRDRYGRHLFGQSLLLSRRLVQAGVPIIQANMGSMNNWDTHNDNCEQLKTRLLPPLDQAVSALLDDLNATGLIDDTLVVMVGEFGRTPKLVPNVGSTNPAKVGRDHWSGVFSALFAGAGVRGGQFIGKSDKIGAYPATRGFYPSDLGATIYSVLGVDPSSMVMDPLGRPLELNRGQVIAPLFSGAAV
ncbi:DUF1501 domain-containing protein [Singulisphaera sp. PoT]|uniref:DUF1501 domain-containing protein n=1 Tax=Singulisphaera sp. PoT TaxID=3411797 RepID=UPI003BF609E8